MIKKAATIFDGGSLLGSDMNLETRPRLSHMETSHGKLPSELVEITEYAAGERAPSTCITLRRILSTLVSACPTANAAVSAAVSADLRPA
jgi:hypothetical protein